MTGIKAMTITLAATLLLGACASNEYAAWKATKNPLLNGHFLQTASEAQIMRQLDGQFDLNAHNPVDGQTPMVTLITWRHDPQSNYRLVKAMLEAGADPNRRTLAPRYPTEYAVARETVLHIAVHEGHPPTIRLLLEKGADPNAENVNGVVPLYTAIKFGQLEAVRLLLEGGADPNYVDSVDRQTILASVRQYSPGWKADGLAPPNPQIIALVRQYGGHE